MLRVLFWLLSLPLLVVIVVFAASNPTLVEVSTWPILEQPILIPLYGMALIGLVIGFLLGALVAFLQGGRTRRRARELARQLESDRRELAVLRGRIDKLEADKALAPASGLPARAA